MEKLLNSATVKKNLVVASLFVTAYEILRASIVDKPKGFLNLAQDFKKGSMEPVSFSEEYRREIVDRVIPEIDQKKGEFHDFYASCLWFQDLGAITEDDVKDIQKIRKHRNDIAHEPVSLLVDDAVNLRTDLLKKAQEILNKIDKWWILEIEIPTSGDYPADHNLTEKDVDSGMTLLLDYFMAVAAEEVTPEANSSDA